MRPRTMLILALIVLLLALAAGCQNTKSGSVDSGNTPLASTAAPAAPATTAIVPSVQTASIPGSGIVGCAPGATVCGNACVSLKTNSSNCGSCGNACPANQPVCTEGQCGTV